MEQASREGGGSQSELNASRSFFHAIITRSVDGVLVLDEDGTILYANPAASSILCRSAEELIGAPFGVPCLPGESVDVELECREGSRSIAEMRVAATRWQRRPAFLATIRDVTERRRSEELVRNEVRRRDEFMATLSHELRTPLSAITGATQLAQRFLEPDCEAGEAVGVVARQCQIVTRLLDDLLDVSRFAYGRIELRRETVPIQEIVEDAVETCLSSLDARDANVDVSLADAPLPVEGDRCRLVQAASNLLRNALKYTPRSKRIEVEVTGDEEAVQLVVNDEGCGIPPESLDTIFDPFVQLGTSCEHGQAGLGMGLPLVRMIVERHDGTIAAESDGIGTGARFVVRLPRAESSLSNNQGLSGGDRVEETDGRRILLVEDNKDLREITQMSLEVNGHDVVAAPGGLRALQLLRTRRFDFALVDLGMPEMDGFELARRIRENDDWADLRLVALTGYGMPEDFERTRQAGFDHHLVKPVDFEDLEHVLAGKDRIPFAALGVGG